MFKILLLLQNNYEKSLISSEAQIIKYFGVQSEALLVAFTKLRFELQNVQYLDDSYSLNFILNEIAVFKI